MTTTSNFIDAKGKFQNAADSLEETDEEIIRRLASLSDMEYERCREQEAEKLGFRVSILDKLVKLERLQTQKTEVVESLEPWHEPVCFNELLDQIEATILKHAIIPLGGSTAITLWIASTFVINQFRIFPKLVIYSPEKRCGKSTVLDLVEAFASKSLFTSNISQAAIYRVIEAYQPTLIIDEADTFIAHRKDEMIGILNSGHTKGRAYIVRTVGDSYETTKFSAWSPMVLASIKPLQGTIMDRAICIELRRKMNHEHVDRIPLDLVDLTKPVRRMLKRWAKDNAALLRNKHIIPPGCGNDRAVDNWIPLFTLASLANQHWQEKVKTAYQLLTRQDEEPSPQVMLLEDIREILSEHKADKIPSKMLVDLLVKLEERPWQEWHKGSAMTQNNLAKMLKSFRIQSKTIRYLNHPPCKGFDKQQFNDAFKRYLPER